VRTALTTARTHGRALG